MGQQIWIRLQAGQTHKNLSLPEKTLLRIWIQQQPGHGSGYSKMSGSGFGEKESKTLPESVKES
jgi:hypothetical protein